MKKKKRDKNQHKKLERAISKQVNIKLELEKFFPDMIGEGKLSPIKFEKLLDIFGESCVKVGIEQEKLRRRIK